MRLRRRRGAPKLPFGRAVLVLQLVAALTFVLYTAEKEQLRIPFLSAEPFEIQVVLPDAKGLLPAKQPVVGVAGTPAGRVTDVHLERGRARVTLELDSELKGRIFRDASVSVRTTSLLQTLMVDVDPGTPARGRMPDGGTIPAARARAFVHIDELTGMLDADTQAQVQVLLAELARGLGGHAPELRATLRELGRATDGATPLARALTERRVLLTRLVDHLDVLLGTLGDRGTQLAEAVRLGDETLAVVARRGPEVEEATRRLAPMLAETRRALDATEALAAPLVPALDALRPAARDLKPAATELRASLPALDRLLGTASDLTRDGAKPARQLADGLEHQADLIENDQKPALQELIGLVGLLEKNRDGIIQFARNISGATSINRRAGTYGQFNIMNFETSPEAFGLAPSAARSADGEPSRLGNLLGEALERTCRTANPMACLLRFQTPGLPRTPLTERPKVESGGAR